VQSPGPTIDLPATVAARNPGATAADPGCFHCGTRCRTTRFARDEKSFCCQGCLTVFELLTENGLTEFYNLSEAAGVRVNGAAKQDQFKFLDEPAVRERLVDFADARLTRVTFHIPAIHCIACVWLLENLFRLKPGLGQSRVNFPRKEAAIAFDTAGVKLSEVVALLASLGYEPELKLSALDAKPRERIARRLWIQLGLAGFAFGNIMLFSISAYLGLDAFAGPGFRKMVGAISLLLALPVVTYSALDYWRAAWTSLRQRLLNIDVPIAAGVAAIFLQSVYEVVSGHGNGYFDSLCGLIFFLLCGKWFQQKTYDRLAFDRDYKSFFPLSVTRLGRRRREESQTSPAASQRLLTSSPTETDEEQISLAQLVVGDRLILRNGELIPADARLVDGPALIDYSFVTGESEPVEKKPEDYLYAGGRQMGGAIEVEMVKAVSQSYLTSLWNQDAFVKGKREALNTLTNKYSQRFTRLVIVVAVGAAVFWAFVNPALSLKAFTSVLIVACPCALALAAPFALGTSQRVLARRNIFLKNPYVIETLARVDAVVFDKTGTLTAAGAGRVTWCGVSPVLTPALSPGERENRPPASSDAETDDSSVRVAKSRDRRQLFPLPGGEGQGEGKALTTDEERWLYSMTRHSTHPLPVRIGEAIAREHFPEPVRSFLETPGCGMEGSVAGHEIWMGAATWLEGRGVKVAHAATEGSVVHVAIDGKYRGGFMLASAVRPEADRLVAGLYRNVQVALLSGDNEKERGRFEALLGDEALLRFNQSPLDKLNFIKQQQETGRIVMMVGDGLNDAGALKQSDTGVAVVEKVSAFSPASDVIVAAGMVTCMADVLRYAKQSVRVVQAAFLISAIYNLAGVAIAASGRLSPVVCAILMPLSSVSVVAFACGAATWLGRRSLGTVAVRAVRGEPEQSEVRP
jgi:Cu+-exporting ATPase